MREVLKNIKEAFSLSKGQDPTEQEILNEVIDRTPMSQFISLKHIDYVENEGTFVETLEGIGVIFEVFLPPFLGDHHESEFLKLFTITYPKNTLIQFFAYASNNIKPYIDAYRSYHTVVPYVGNPEILRKVISNRADFYEKAAIDGFWPGQNLKPRWFKNYFSIMIPFKTYRNNPERTYHDAKVMANRIKSLLSSIGLNPVPPTPMHVVTLYKEIFNAGVQGLAEYDNSRTVRNQTIMSETITKICDNGDLHFKSNGVDKYIRSYSIKKYPRRMSLWDFNNLLFPWDAKDMNPTLYDPFGFMLTVVYDDWEKRKMVLHAKSKHATQEQKKRDTTFFNSINKKAGELRYVEELLDNNHKPMSAYFTFFITAKAQSELEAVCYDVVERFKNANFQLQQEYSKGNFAAFHEALPMNHIQEREDFISRRLTLFDASLASMIPWLAGVSGSTTPHQINCDRKGQICFYDRFESNANYNQITIAQSGSGKSFSECDSDVHDLTAPGDKEHPDLGALIRVIDIGRSYASFCETIGGQHIVINEDMSPCFNYFTEVITDRHGNIHEDELETIIPLAGFLAGYDLNMKDLEGDKGNHNSRVASILIAAHSYAFNIKKRDAGLKDVYDALIHHIDSNTSDELNLKIAQAMQPYATGAYKHYFNGRANINYDNQYVLLELEEVQFKDPRLQLAMMFSLILKILRELFMGKKKRGHFLKTVIKFDETHMYLSDPAVAKVLSNFARRGRKYFGSLNVTTQGFNEFTKSTDAMGIFENSVHRKYLKMKPETISSAIKSNHLVMSEFQEKWFRSLFTMRGMFSEIYYDTETIQGVVRLLVDKYSYGVFTTTPHEKDKLEQLCQEYDMTLDQVLDMLTVKEKLGEYVKMFGVPELAVQMALDYQHRYGRDVKLGEILVRMGIMTEEQLKVILQKQETQLTWEYVFS